MGRNCAATHAKACCKSAGDDVAQTKYGRACDAKRATREESGKEWRWKEFELTQRTQVRRVRSEGEKLARSLWREETDARETGSTMMMQRRAED